MDISKLKEKIPTVLYDKLKILNGTPEEEQQRQNYLQSICQRLIGDDLDFEQYPVFFCIVDDKNPNAAFVPGKTPKILDTENEFYTDEEIKEAEKEQYPIVFITKGLLEMVENEDQLAYILGHELGHLRQDFLLDDKHKNSKMEEITSDFGSLDMMAKAGYNINEARKIAADIFHDNDKCFSLKQIISRALDEHPNDESRLNAIDIKIKTIEDNYQKENIDVNDITPTPVSKNIKEECKKNRYVSLFEKELQELGYYEASLPQKQEILLSYMHDISERREELWEHTYSGYLLPDHYRKALNTIVFDHITQLRQEMPRRIIKQSDADYFRGWLNRAQEKESLDKWIELVGKEYSLSYGLTELQIPYDQTERQSILESFPFKIVPDDEYEHHVAIEEAKRQEQRKNIDNGTDLSLQFWDKILTMHEDTYYYYGVLAINPLQQIDLSKTNFGKSYLATIERILNEEPYFNMTKMQIMDCNYFYTNIEENLDKSVRLKFTTPMTQFFYRFNPKTFPSLNLEMTENPTIKKIPPHTFNHGIVSSKFGIASELIMDGVYFITYNADYQNPCALSSEKNYWMYCVDAEGNILSSFSPEKREEKEQEIIEQKRAEFYKQVADVVKEDYATLQKLKQDPSSVNLSSRDLLRLKQYTGSINYEINRSDANWRLMVYNAKLTSNSPDITYRTQMLKDVIKEQYTTLANESPLAGKHKKFDLDLILQHLTEDERRFASTEYVAENDDAVFNALYKDADKSYSIAMNSFRPDEYAEYQPNNYVITSNLSSLFTHEQLIKYHKRFFEFANPETLKSDIHSVANAINIELKHINAYIEQQIHDNPKIAYKDIDFSQYQPLFAEEMSKKLDIPTDLSNYKRSDEQRSAKPLFLSYVLTAHILQSKTNKLPLGEVFKYNDTSLYFNNVVKEKFVPFLLNRENYPEDTLEAIKTFNNIPSSVIDMEKVGPVIIDIIHSEKDHKKALKATLLFLRNFKYDNSDASSDLKNKLLEDSIIFDKKLPLMQRIGAYQQIALVSGFADDYKIQNQLLTGFIEEIEAIKDPYERNVIYDIFISKENRISDPDIRRTYQRLWVESVFEACGKQIDDNSAQLHEKISPFLFKLHESHEDYYYGSKKTVENINMADKIEIAKMMADRFVSQQKLSMMIKPKPASFDEMNEGNRSDNSMIIAGFDAIKLIMRYDKSEASSLIDFLLSKGEMHNCVEYSKHLGEIFKTHDIQNKKVSPDTLQILHREFWGYPLEARAVLINELLYSASSKNSENRWEDIFQKVAPKIFPNADSEMSKIGTEFLHSYIKSRKENERTLYLAAMMVAANENSSTTDPEKSIAKGIRLFLENSGPAAIKLGQAMASYTDVPKFIRDEMQELKSNASRPSRWEVYEWLDFYAKKDGDNKLNYGQDIWLGKIIGSASYFVTLEKGKFENGQIPQDSDRVTKILRAGAKIASDKEFKIFENMLYDLAQKGVMKNGIDSFVRLVKQAQETVEVETNLEIGYSQLETAKELYKEKQIDVDGHSFKLHVADWPEYGKNWADLERAQGIDLDQIQDPQYKKALSKAYFTVELMNMLSGSRFDHDRHCKQMKIDTQNNVIGLFDTGAMAIVDPSEKDKELLGRVIYRTLQKTLEYSSDGTNAFGKVGNILSSEIEGVYTDKLTDSTYLTECQRGLLALTDYYKDLSANDFIECINSAINNKDMPIDKSIVKGFVQEGIKDIGIFESKQPLLSHKDKEALGSLIFNVYASASVDGTENIGQIIKNEVQQLQDKGVNMPILSVISDKLSESTHQSLGFNIPKEFMPTVSEIVGQKDIDVAILKGVMKEAVNSIDLQGQKDNYPEQDRQELGKLLYDTFDLMISKRREGEKIDMAEAFLSLQKTGNYQTQLGKKIAAVVKTAKQISSSQTSAHIDINEIVKTSLLSGNMDKHIAKGISEQFKQKNPNLILRAKLAKGLNLFLSQNTEDMGVVKKSLIKMLVRKPNVIQQVSTKLDTQICAPETNKKLIEMIRGYTEKFARIINKNRTNPNIEINNIGRDN